MAFVSSANTVLVLGWYGKAKAQKKRLSLLFSSPPFFMPFPWAVLAGILQQCKAEFLLQDLGASLRYRGCQGPHGCHSLGSRANRPVLFKSCGATGALPAFTAWRKIKNWDLFKHLFKSFQKKSYECFLPSYIPITTIQGPHTIKGKLVHQVPGNTYIYIYIYILTPHLVTFNVSHMMLMPLCSPPSWWPSYKSNLPENETNCD